MDIYEKGLKLLWKKQRNELKKELENNNKKSREYITLKIKNWLKKVNLNNKHIKVILDFIDASNDEMKDVILSFFMKDPSKQNSYEKILKEKIQNSFKDNKNFSIKSLSKSGPNTYYALHEKIETYGDKTKKIIEGVRSLDFLIEYKNKKEESKKIYIFHKYTKETGGAQNKQLTEAINQAKHIGESLSDIVWLCLDGEYYNEERLDQIKKVNKDVVIVNINNIVDKIKESIGKCYE